MFAYFRFVQVKSMPTPMHQSLTHDELFPGPNEIDWKLLRDHLHREGRVLAEHALEIIRRMGELLRSLAFQRHSCVFDCRIGPIGVTEIVF